MADDKVTEKAEQEHVFTEKDVHSEAMAQMKDVAEHSGISEKRLLLKTDLHVVPILFLLFLCAFIDR